MAGDYEKLIRVITKCKHVLQTIHFCLDPILRNALSKQWIVSTGSVFILMVAFSPGSLLNQIHI